VAFFNDLHRIRLQESLCRVIRVVAGSLEDWSPRLAVRGGADRLTSAPWDPTAQNLLEPPRKRMPTPIPKIRMEFAVSGGLFFFSLPLPPIGRPTVGAPACP